MLNGVLADGTKTQGIRTLSLWAARGLLRTRVLIRLRPEASAARWSFCLVRRLIAFAESGRARAAGG